MGETVFSRTKSAKRVGERETDLGGVRRMRVFWVLRDLYRRLFVSPPRTPRLSDEAAVRDALRKKLELQSQLRVLRQRAREKQEEEMERKLREESAMLEELKKTRESFGQQIEHIQR